MKTTNQVREKAHFVRNNPFNGEALADALELIANAIDGKPCTDCGQQKEDEQGQGIGNDAPDVGLELNAGV